MGSASREALAAARTALAAQGAAVGVAVGEELFTAVRLLDESASLRTAIGDPSADSAAKVQLAERVFASRLSPAALEVVRSAAQQRWSNPAEMLAGIEELGIRAIAISAPKGADIEGELFAFGIAVSSDAELELALRGKLAPTAAKAALVEKLLDRAAPQTLAIARQLVVQPRGRSVRVSVRWAGTVVADEASRAVAVVSSAAPISTTQLDRLEAGLSKQYGRAVTVNHVIDPTLLGGLRVQIADDVIDGSIAARINEVKLQLAG